MLARGSFGFPLVTPEPRWGSESGPGSKDDDKLDDSSRNSDSSTGAKPKRKRPKFIRKVD